MSSPYANPPGPTLLADKSTSIPPPLPRSSTVSPAFNRANAVGLPQPSEASNDSCGISLASCAVYRFMLIGSSTPVQQPLPLPQQPPASPAVTRSADAL